MTARAIKGVAMAAQLSEAARAALLSAKFNGSGWKLQTSTPEATGELRALKLARESNREFHVTILGMKVRAIVARAS